jgi:exosortase E/protease (VPEID-CTERM system)
MNLMPDIVDLSRKDVGAPAPGWAFVCARVGLLCVLLLVELMSLTVRFDSEVLTGSSGLLDDLIGNVAIIPQLLAVVLTATLIFGGREVAALVNDLQKPLTTHQRWVHWLVVHLVMFGLLYASTLYLFEMDHGETTFLFLIWSLVSMLTLLSWVLAIVPLQVLRHEMGKVVRPLAIGASVGLFGWFVGQLSIGIWDSLAFVTFRCVGILLSLCGFSVVEDVGLFALGTNDFSVRIAPECSGYEGMGLAVVFISTYLWWRREDHRFPQSLMLVPFAVGLMFVVNVLRIVTLIIIGHLGWADFALGAFHSQAGWLAFNATALCVVALSRISPYFSSTAKPERSATLESVPLLAPFVCLTAVIMLTGASGLEFDWLYPIRILAVLVTIALFLRAYKPEVWRLDFHWVGPVIGILVYVIWMASEPASDGSHDLLFESAKVASGWAFYGWLILRVFGSVVTVPIAEEFAFRGYLLPWLAGRGEQSSGAVSISWAALGISSLAFGLLHPGRWIAGSLAGLLFGLAYYQRGRLMDAVVAHATTNAIIAAHVILMSRWSLWC